MPERQKLLIEPVWNRNSCRLPIMRSAVRSPMPSIPSRYIRLAFNRTSMESKPYLTRVFVAGRYVF